MRQHFEVINENFVRQLCIGRAYAGGGKVRGASLRVGKMRGTVRGRL